MKEQFTTTIDGVKYNTEDVMKDPVLRARYQYLSGDSKNVTLNALKKQLAQATSQKDIKELKKTIADMERKQAKYSDGSMPVDVSEVTANPYERESAVTGQPNPGTANTQNTQQTEGFSLTGGNLRQGSIGDEVRKLQMALGITADGIFGPKTAEAVKAYQAKNGLAPDGIVGPLTASALSKNSTGNSGTPTSGAFGAPSSPRNVGGTDPAVPNSPPTPAGALIGAIADTAESLTTSGNAITLEEALNAAKKDKNIIAKYSDALKLDTQSFMQQLDQVQFSASDEARKQQLQFEDDRRQLAENSAAAGQAYSGLRNRAQQQLGEAESGIVSSSRNALKKNLQDLTTAFESKYGSDATKIAKAQFTDPFASSGISLSGLKTFNTPTTSTLSGQLAGGITGTQPIAKQADILTKGTELYNLGQTPKIS